MTWKFVVPCWGCVWRFRLIFPLIETHPPTFNGDDLLLLFCCALKLNRICPCEFCVKFPAIKTLAPEEMFKFALFSKFPWTSVVVFPATTISPVFVSVPLFGVNFHLHSFCKKTHETFPCVKSNKGALNGQRWQFGIT